MNEKFVKSKMELARIRSENKKGIKTSLQIQGTGPLNRDGVPELPPDQRRVKNWPVLDLGVDPKIDSSNWQLKISGLCSKPRVFNYNDFLNLTVVKDESDFHCVTGWSQFSIKWEGVRLSEIAKVCEVQPEAHFVYFTGYDGYSTNITMTEAMKDDVLLVFKADGSPLPKVHGGPVRVITPQLWAWKGTKWIQGIEFLNKDRRGFWEQRGYSNSAIPWLNDRYTADEQTD